MNSVVSIKSFSDSYSSEKKVSISDSLKAVMKKIQQAVASSPAHGNNYIPTKK